MALRFIADRPQAIGGTRFQYPCGHYHWTCKSSPGGHDRENEFQTTGRQKTTVADGLTLPAAEPRFKDQQIPEAVAVIDLPVHMLP